MAGPSQELLDAIAGLTPEQQRQALELAWRQEAAKQVAAGGNVEPPWHTRFIKGNAESKNRKGKISCRKMLKRILARTDANGVRVVEELMLAALEHAMKGKGDYFKTIVALDGGIKEEELDGRQELTIRVRPVEALQPKEQSDAA